MVTTETKATHTPGPWKVANVTTRGVPQLKVETCESGRWDRVDIAKLNVSNQQSEANARLIASAPGLLEALEAFLAYDRDGSYLRSDATTMHEQITAKAEAAVRTASGE